MKMPANKPAYLIGGAVVLAVAYVWLRGVKGVASDVSGAVVDLADGVVTGTVLGAGDVIGLPRTNVGACTQAVYDFRAAPWWKQAYMSLAVSANCSASDYWHFIGTAKAPGEI